MSTVYKVEGDYRYINEDGVKDVKKFNSSITLSEGLESQEALSVIKKLLPETLAKKDKDFRSLRTCSIKDISESKQESKPSELETLLEEAVKLNCMPAKLDAYTTEESKIKILKKEIKAAKKTQESDK